MKTNINSKGVAGYAPTLAILALALTFTPALADNCNGAEYDPATQFCGSAEADTSMVLDKCGGKEYNPETQLCEKNKIKDYKCGSKNYSNYKQFCLSNKIYDKCPREASPDGKYDPKTETCCKFKCKDKECFDVYKPSTHVCKESGIAEKAKGTIKPPTARDIDMGSGDGSRSKNEIAQVVNTNTPSLEALYKKHLKKSDFTGKVTLKFTVAPSGEIISIAVTASTTGNAEFNEEVKTAVSKWKWKEIKSGNATATIPFNFN